MKSGFIIIAALLLCYRANADVSLAWNSPTNAVPVSYILFHGTDSQPPEIINCPGTNYIYDGTLALGAHYFTVAAIYQVDGKLQSSDWANLVAITNVPGVVVQSITLTSTNLADWSPWTTNRLVLCATAPQEFFRSVTTIEPTNVILAPLPAPK